MLEADDDDPLHPLTQLNALNNSFFASVRRLFPLFIHLSSQDKPTLRSISCPP